MQEKNSGCFFSEHSAQHPLLYYMNHN